MVSSVRSRIGTALRGALALVLAAGICLPATAISSLAASDGIAFAAVNKDEQLDLSAVGFEGISITLNDLANYFPEETRPSSSVLESVYEWITNASAYSYVVHDGHLDGWLPDKELPYGWEIYGDPKDYSFDEDPDDLGTYRIVKTELDAANILDYADCFAPSCRPDIGDVYKTLLSERDNISTENRMEGFDGAYYEGGNLDQGSVRFFSNLSEVSGETFEGHDVVKTTGYAAPTMCFDSMYSPLCEVPEYEGEIPEGKRFDHWTLLVNQTSVSGVGIDKVHQSNGVGYIPTSLEYSSLSSLPDDAFWFYDGKYYYLDPSTVETLDGSCQTYVDLYPGEFVDTWDCIFNEKGRYYSVALPVFVDEAQPITPADTVSDPSNATPGHPYVDPSVEPGNAVGTPVVELPEDVHVVSTFETVETVRFPNLSSGEDVKTGEDVVFTEAVSTPMISVEVSSGDPVVVDSDNDGTVDEGTVFTPGQVFVSGQTDGGVPADAQTEVVFHAYEYGQDVWGDMENDPRDGTEIVPPADAKPVSGVEYKIYYVAPEKIDGGYRNPTIEEVETEPAKYGLPEGALSGEADPDYSAGPTAVDGTARVDVANGIYYVVPIEPDGSSRITDSFLFSAPMTNPDGDGFLDTIHIYPKTSVGPEIEKAIEVDGADYTAAGFAVGDEVSFSLDVIAPNDLYGTVDTDGDKVNDAEAYAQSFAVSDTLDEALDYIDGSASVSSGDTVLVASDDYALNYDAGSRTLSVVFTQAGMKKIELADGTDSAYPTVSVDFRAALNDAAIAVDYVLNDADVDYTSRNGSVYDKTSNEVEVHTGSAAFTKIDGFTGADLAGATFGIAATQEDALAGDFIATAISADDGIIRFDGLAFGAAGDAYDVASSTYYVMETAAPAGYELLRSPVEVVVDYQSDDAGEIEAFKVANNPTYVLPMTGGMGALLIILVGVSIFAAAVAARTKRDRRAALED